MTSQNKYGRCCYGILVNSQHKMNADYNLMPGQYLVEDT